ncbi:MAG: uroporphyrinogen-III C-methyltransferase [Bacteroidetes bacterium]|nr:uroporphyrinogen-III C-methyltransferase [Bacteroidota bacterium]
MSTGTIYITGAGPGDEKLITLRAVEVLKMADAVVYDYLVNDSLLAYCRPDCERIYAGKKANHHTLPQDEINALLIELAQKHTHVVRLKGGDPFVFGRGGEEAMALKQAGIRFEIIPGVTSGIAVPAYAGIPVTHRDSCSMVTFVSGHKAVNKPDDEINWQALATLESTLVFYMGVSNLGKITSKLIENGKFPDTAIALIQWGTTLNQLAVCGNLSNIVEKVKEAQLKPPALIVIGDVVNMREELNWFK